MDRQDLDPVLYRRVLADLARVNRWTLASRPTLAFLRRATRRGDRLRLLDVGFGHGDMLRTVSAWAKTRGIEVELVGVDINPNSLPAARAATSPTLGIDYFVGDYRDVPTGPFDFIVSSLVAHHMDADELTTFIRFMETNARRGWLINDLHRHRVAHRAYPLLARLLRVQSIVREDGALSIARAFRPAEWRSILRDAGLPDGTARVEHHFPFRLCVARLF